MRDPEFKNHITFDLNMCRYAVHLSINNLINDLFRLVRDSLESIRQAHDGENLGPKLKTYKN
jgi:hypothetical protein